MKATVFILFCLAFDLISAEDGVCPPDSEGITFLPNPEDCSKYYECSDGQEIAMECSPGLFWNQDILSCDLPQNVDCGSISTDIPTGPTHDPLCPFPSDEITYIPNPDDCTRYSECYNGKRTDMTCPDGLFWSQEELTCDFPDKVDCASTNTPSGPTSTHDPLCPFPSNGTTYFPDPDDCSKYWECVNGNRYKLACPGELYWNQEILSCDLRSNVECDNDDN